MNIKVGYREFLSLTMEVLARLPRSQWAELVEQVLREGERRQLLTHTQGMTIGGRTMEAVAVGEFVREAMWECLLRRIIVFGSDHNHPDFPFYRVTEYGASVLKDSAKPQPYDPDGFLRYFRDACPSADPAVRSYLAEAVQAFNADCVRSAAVMIGCASEKLLLLLAETFEDAISDSEKKVKFTKEIDSKRIIYAKFAVLRDRLDRMVLAKKLPHALGETVASELPSGFEMLRRCRNAAGHPDVPENVTSDTVFLNLRAFIEYARRMQALIDHFRSAPADW